MRKPRLLGVLLSAALAVVYTGYVVLTVLVYDQKCAAQGGQMAVVQHFSDYGFGLIWFGAVAVPILCTPDTAMSRFYAWTIGLGLAIATPCLYDATIPFEDCFTFGGDTEHQESGIMAFMIGLALLALLFYVLFAGDLIARAVRWIARATSGDGQTHGNGRC
jgi:hypothetical protein